MIEGLIIPRSYNDYFSRSDPAAIHQLVKQFTDDELSGTSENPIQNKVVKAAIDDINAVIPAGASTSDKLALNSDVTAIEAKIPAQASAQNQLADKDFVNSSIGTNTANYISNNGEPFTSVAALEAYSGTVTNNDYAFVTGTDSAGNVYYDRYKATVSGSSVTWAKEYRLNNSSFTAAQWAAIQSGITAAKVAQYDAMAGSNVVVPVGTVAGYEGISDPADGQWLICDGRDTTGTNIELQTYYPSLYTFLGGTNVLPEIFDHSRLGELEILDESLIGNTEGTAWVAPYDGILNCSVNTAGQSGVHYFYARHNGTSNAYATNAGSGGMASNIIEFKKGDKIWYTAKSSQCHFEVRYYKQHKIIKAVSTTDAYTPPSSEILQIEQYFDNGIAALKNGFSISTEETPTGRTFMGKPTYTKAFNLANVTSGTILLTGVDKVVISGGWHQRNGTSNCKLWPQPYSGENIVWELNPTTHKIVTLQSYTIYAGEGWLEYTKTTD